MRNQRANRRNSGVDKFGKIVCNRVAFGTNWHLQLMNGQCILSHSPPAEGESLNAIQQVSNSDDYQSVRGKRLD